MGTELWINSKEIVKVKYNEEEFCADSVLELSVETYPKLFRPNRGKILTITNKMTGDIEYRSQNTELIDRILNNKMWLNTSETIIHIRKEKIFVPRYIKISLTSKENFYFIIEKEGCGIEELNKRIENSRSGLIRIDDLGDRLYFK